MPYYAYAIETGSKLNHLCGTFTDYLDAEICERDQGRSYLEDRAFVKMIYAQNQTPALQRMKQIKRESGSA